MFDINKIVRENIRDMVPYSSARDEFKGTAGIFLDANENSLGSPIDDITENVNRYPDPLQLELKEKISKIKGVPADNIFVGNGSDEAIDLLFRAFCIPGKDKAIVCPPTYGMYEVAANINDVGVIKINLIPESFQLQVDEILSAMGPNVKLIFFCCPNNPTGNGIWWADIKKVIENFSGIVVLDEAYINFASYQSMIRELPNYPNLVILQTFSKAWGMAGLRLGMAFASVAIISILNKIKPPYNINAVSQQLGIQALDNLEEVNARTKEIVEQRKILQEKLKSIRTILKVYPSEANFLLVKVNDAGRLYKFLVAKQIVVRDRSKAPNCSGCLRITVGTASENKLLLQALAEYEKQNN